MKRSADKWHARLSEHGAFCGYRWLAWAIAGLALTLPDRPADSLPRDAGLFMLLLIANLALTFTARGYVRLARQRPALLALDLLFGSAVVWLSGGGLLPFLPYALSALVLPTLIFGWRGALLSSLTFIALDQASLALGAQEGAAALSLFIARVLTPSAFAFCWVALGQFLPRASSVGQVGSRNALVVDSPPAQRRPNAAPESGTVVRLAERPGLERPGLLPPSTPAPIASTALARSAHAPQFDPARRVIYDLTPGPTVPLPAGLEQLAASVSRQCGLAIRVTLVGATQRLNPSQHSVLLRAAQEALLNVQQHARAHTVQLTLTFEPRAVTLVVQDDGVGLLDGTYERPGLHALRAVRYRLAELDGQLAVFESESGGVTVRATLPLE